MAKITNDKPIFSLLKKDSDNYTKIFWSALSYCRTELDAKALTKATEVWVKKNTDLDPKVMFKLKDADFESIGRFCYVLNNGGELKDDHLDSVVTSIHSLYERAKNKTEEVDEQHEEKVEEKSVVKKVGIQEHMLDRAREVCAEVDGWIDEFVSNPSEIDLKKKEVKKYFVGNNLKAGHMRYVKQFYEPALKEFKEVLVSDDEDVKFGYKHISVSNIKKLISFYEDIINCSSQVSVPIKRKPKLKKATDANKLVAKMKYLVEDTASGIKSVHPVHIIGSKELWTYNTKTRKLAYYEAYDVTGISAKGSCIKNFSVKSVEKTVRKDSMDIAKFAKMSKSNKKEAFAKIKSVETKAKGKISETILILSVEK